MLDAEHQIIQRPQIVGHTHPNRSGTSVCILDIHQQTGRGPHTPGHKRTAQRLQIPGNTHPKRTDLTSYDIHTNISKTTQAEIHTHKYFREIASRDTYLQTDHRPQSLWHMHIKISDTSRARTYSHKQIRAPTSWEINQRMDQGPHILRPTPTKRPEPQMDWRPHSVDKHTRTDCHRLRYIATRDQTSHILMYIHKQITPWAYTRR